MGYFGGGFAEGGEAAGSCGDGGEDCVVKLCSFSSSSTILFLLSSLLLFTFPLSLSTPSFHATFILLSFDARLLYSCIGLFISSLLSLELALAGGLKEGLDDELHVGGITGFEEELDKLEELDDKLDEDEELEEMEELGEMDELEELGDELDDELDELDDGLEELDELEEIEELDGLKELDELDELDELEKLGDELDENDELGDGFDKLGEELDKLDKDWMNGKLV
ncbi:MAG: hypothetical protein LBF70_00975 [Holosporales bacterium]|nr:hypothetical protein [Holosporales bacterium]